MSQSPIQVSQKRSNEIFQGKAGSTIAELMVENAQLTAIVESLSQQLSEAMEQRTPPSPRPTQDPSA